MDIGLGEIKQLGFVVPDLDRAVDDWVGAMGAGPFFRMDHVRFASYRHRGVPSDPDISIALGNCGSMQIELIELHGEAASPFHEFARRGGSGPQHYSVWATDYDAKLEHVARLGLAVICEGRTATARFCFVAAAPLIGCDLEILEFEPKVRSLMDGIRASSVGWDGSDPVRPIVR